MREPNTVAEAARQLDEIDPMWFNKVDLSELDMDHPCRCIFGQVFNDQHKDFHDMFEKLYGRKWAGPVEKPTLFMVFCDESTEEWVRELNRRRKGRAMRDCSCGSGEERYPLYDGYGIYLCYACSACEKEKLRGYRKDIMERYECDEPIDEDY